MRRPSVISPQDPTHPSVVFYCPDTHVVYDGRTPTERGIGGGVTARVRMARALARAGHPVTMVCNCSHHEMVEGVAYVPLSQGSTLSGDVVVLNTSGGELDLSDASRLGIDANLVILWASSLRRPKGVSELPIDFVYAKSNFLRNVVKNEWGVGLPVFVSYNGFEESAFANVESLGAARDSFRLIYLGHPIKGLAPATEILRRLRRIDTRFSLHVFGNEALWGQPVTSIPNEEGLFSYGLVGQDRLAEELKRSSYALHLQTIQEVLGNSLLDSMRGGCVVLASAVGAFPELIRDGVDGLLVHEPSPSEAAIAFACERVLEMTRGARSWSRMSEAASKVPWSSQIMAEVWRAHWEWNKQPGAVLTSPCALCGSPSLNLADGRHCTGCGEYMARERAQTVVERA